MRGTNDFVKVQMDVVSTLGDVDKRKTCHICGGPRYGELDGVWLCYRHYKETWRAKGATIASWEELEGLCTETIIVVPSTGRLIAGQCEILSAYKAKEIARLKSVLPTLRRGIRPHDVFQDWIHSDGSGLVDAEGKVY